MRKAGVLSILFVVALAVAVIAEAQQDRGDENSDNFASSRKRPRQSARRKPE